MTKQGRAYLLGISAVLFWSTVASAFKLSLRHLDTFQLLLWASAASCIALFSVLTVQRKLSLIFSFSKKQYLQSLGFGCFNPLLYYLVLIKAYDLLPAQEAQTINFTWAITLSLLAIPLLKQKVSLFEILGAFVSYFGVVVISTKGNVLGFEFSDPLGVALALFSTILWALYWILNTKDQRDPVAGLFLNFLFSLPLTFIVCLIFSDPWNINLEGLLGAGYVGFFEMGFTFALWLSALKLSSNAAKMANLIFIAPFISLVLIHYLVGEEIHISTMGGLALIIAGLLLQKYRRK